MEREEEEEESNEEKVLGSNSSPSSAAESDKEKSSFVTPKRGKSRGPGAKKTKLLASADEYRKKKSQIQEGFLEVQKERQVDFKAFVKNHARNKAFEMAALGYKTFKDTDPEEAEKYKTHMRNIIHGNTDGDADSNEMPPLDGETAGV